VTSYNVCGGALNLTQPVTLVVKSVVMDNCVVNCRSVYLLFNGVGILIDVVETENT